MIRLVKTNVNESLLLKITQQVDLVEKTREVPAKDENGNLITRINEETQETEYAYTTETYMEEVYSDIYGFTDNDELGEDVVGLPENVVHYKNFTLEMCKDVVLADIRQAIQGRIQPELEKYKNYAIDIIMGMVVSEQDKAEVLQYKEALHSLDTELTFENCTTWENRLVTCPEQLINY